MAAGNGGNGPASVPLSPGNSSSGPAGGRGSELTSVSPSGGSADDASASHSAPLSPSASPRTASTAAMSLTENQICLIGSLQAAVSGTVMGSIFGFGSGLFKRQGFKGALKEAGSSAKAFGLMSGVHTMVSCYLKRIRGKEDAINTGVAGCATGLVLSWGSTPQNMIQSCVGFGAFSYIFERLNPPPAAVHAAIGVGPCESVCSVLCPSIPTPDIPSMLGAFLPSRLVSKSSRTSRTRRRGVIMAKRRVNTPGEGLEYEPLASSGGSIDFLAEAKAEATESIRAAGLSTRVR
ncbi:hypothetical protein CBR_g19503 [Chara braunii]|uniref:Mitochondrial import inner membrane translocase subunit TIM22 n=1 Tax=Chara braunii TaxID=69332 RepID=A0A388KY53_CHABU|nr:hypothetical protein CBR_g19503 [Chara braunii]|eukprot:GBG74990.1 hypothetical protein CBR_g19503 [Chara braunii]